MSGNAQQDYIIEMLALGIRMSENDCIRPLNSGINMRRN